MTKMKVRVRDSHNLKAYRALQLNLSDDVSPYLSYAVGSFPHFVSTAELEKGSQVTIKIAGKAVWKIEAGEGIKQGQGVYTDGEGRVIPRITNDSTPAQLMGYAANEAKTGEIVDVVRQTNMNGYWLNKVKKVVDSEEGE